MNAATYSLDPADRSKIKAWGASLSAPITIQQIPSDHDLDPDFTAFAQEFSRLVPGVTFHPEKESQGTPGFKIAPNIRYTALPMGKELPPFLRALNSKKTPSSPPATSVLECPLELFIALQCPHCPAMVDTLIPLAQEHSHIRLDIIDGSLFPERAQAQGVTSAPCLILDQNFRWTGKVEPQEILAMAQNRNPAQLSSQSLKNILEDGKAQWIAQAMVEAKQIFPAFTQLLLHPTWSVRLGAMVVVESLAETAPQLIGHLCPPLMEAFPSADLSLKGDILYALGEAGDTKVGEWIKKQGPKLDHSDLKDAAAEALETIESKSTH